MYSFNTFATIALLCSSSSVFALPSKPFPPGLSSLLTRRTTPDASSTDFTCEAQVPQITSCNSKTAAYSCFLAAQDACDIASTDRQNYTIGGQSSSGTCTAVVYLNSFTFLTFADCTAAFQRINDGCVSPGEEPNPNDSEPTMRGWQNTDPGNLNDDTYNGCGNPVDKSLPSYELASNNCVGRWGTGCNGQNRPVKHSPLDQAPITARPPPGWPWHY